METDVMVYVETRTRLFRFEEIEHDLLRVAREDQCATMPDWDSMLHTGDWFIDSALSVYYLEVLVYISMVRSIHLGHFWMQFFDRLDDPHESFIRQQQIWPAQLA